VSTPALNTLHRPLNPALQWSFKSNYIKVNCHAAKYISKIFGPSSTNMINQEHMHENRDDLDDQWRQDVALTLEESLSGVKKCKTINGGQKLKQVIADYHCGFIVNVFEKKNESL
jgi:hypothetical protein